VSGFLCPRSNRIIVWFDLFLPIATELRFEGCGLRFLGLGITDLIPILGFSSNRVQYIPMTKP